MAGCKFFAFSSTYRLKELKSEVIVKNTPDLKVCYIYCHVWVCWICLFIGSFSSRLNHPKCSQLKVNFHTPIYALVAVTTFMVTIFPCTHKLGVWNFDTLVCRLHGWPLLTHELVLPSWVVWWFPISITISHAYQNDVLVMSLCKCLLSCIISLSKLIMFKEAVKLLSTCSGTSKHYLFEVVP